MKKEYFGYDSLPMTGSEMDKLIELKQNVRNLPCFEIDGFIFVGDSHYWLTRYVKERPSQKLIPWLQDMGLLMTQID